jgi:hypothetical protein
MFTVSFPTPCIAEDTVKSAEPCELIANPCAPAFTDPVLMVRGLLLLACRISVTLDPTPPEISFVKLVFVPANPPRMELELKVILPALLMGFALNTNFEDPPPVEFVAKTFPAPTMPPDIVRVWPLACGLVFAKITSASDKLTVPVSAIE